MEFDIIRHILYANLIDSMLRCKIYASDEGYGHLVRQQAIAEALSALQPDIEFDLQTRNQADAASWLFPKANVIRRFNNIIWPRSESGSPNLEQTKIFYEDYIERSITFMQEEDLSQSYNFILSDLVYEAFGIAKQTNTPAFGICHFTWDWFFSKLYPLPVQRHVIEHMQKLATHATKLYFSEFTPPDLIQHYRKQCIVHPLIVRKQYKSNITVGNKFKVLLMDSGANVLATSIRNAIEQLPRLPDIQFFIHENYAVQADNITLMPANVPIIDYLQHMDLVISRGGFNTISECIAWRVPLLLISEHMNPEVERNLFCVKQQGLGSFTSLDKFEHRFSSTLQHFIDGEYDQIKQNMASHAIRTDGADVVAASILDQIL